MVDGCDFVRERKKVVWREGEEKRYKIGVI